MRYFPFLLVSPPLLTRLLPAGSSSFYWRCQLPDSPFQTIDQAQYTCKLKLILKSALESAPGLFKPDPGRSLNSTMQNFKAEQARAATSQRWKAAQKPTRPDEWIKRAQEASSILKIDAVERDSAGKSPFAEVQLLKDAGLVNLLGPRKYGGAGETWQTSYKVTTEISKADASIGHLLGNHYSWYVDRWIQPGAF